MASPDQNQPGLDMDSTRWSIVLAAGGEDSGIAREALEVLCKTYWYPLYAYARRRAATVDEAQDLTQAFFAELLEKNFVADARPERGRFRAFLLTAFKHFLANQWHKSRAQKRGGDRRHISLDFHEADRRYALAPAGDQAPETLFEKQWAVTLVNRVLQQLRDECVESGKGLQYELLKSYLAGVPADASFAEAAEQLQTSAGAARVAAHRLRQRYRDLLRKEISETVSSEEEIDEEIRDLFGLLE